MHQLLSDSFGTGQIYFSCSEELTGLEPHL